MIMKTFRYVCLAISLLHSIFLFSTNQDTSIDINSLRIQKDELSKAYISPSRIIKVFNETSIHHAEMLLQPGNGQAELIGNNTCEINSTITKPSIILDFGKEIHGGIQFVLGPSNKKTIQIRIRFGESVGECCSEITSKNAEIGFSTNDHSMRDRILRLSRYGSSEFGNTGFRFVRIDFLDDSCKCNIKEIRAFLIYRDIPYLGSFHCSDARLDSIWLAGAYTVHLNMQEFLWDGIKRDRIIWLGDMHPEISTLISVFGKQNIVERTLDLACLQYPLPHWMNDMSAYSMWYIIIHYEWYMYSGDLDFLIRHQPYISGLVRQISNRIDTNGHESLSEEKFLDWPSSTNALGVESGYRALLCWALKDAQLLANIMRDKETSEIAKASCGRLNLQIKDPNHLKQAAALMSIAGTMNSNKAYKKYFAKTEAKGFSTFYGYYMLKAMANAGKYEEAMHVIKLFWGGMLDLGATTFWEDFNLDWMKNAARIDEIVPSGKIDIHGQYGDYCYKGYRHSLCHAWASGPTAWLSQYVLGINILEPGCRTIEIKPHLGNLKWVSGTFPTPLGVISIHHQLTDGGKIITTIDAPKGIKIINNNSTQK